MSNEPVYIRLYPYEPKRGYLVQTFCMHGTVYRGGPRPTWYVVDQITANMLRPLLQRHDDPDSKPLFQFCTKEEKDVIAKDEQEMFLAQLGVVSRTVVSPNVQPPPTVDIRPKAAQESAPPPAPEPPVAPITSAAVTSPRRGRGRASALPEPRVVLAPNTATAATVPVDSKGGGT